MVAINTKRININRYPNKNKYANEITLKSSGENEIIYFDGKDFLFKGHLPGYTYEFKVDACIVLKDQDFSWVEANNGNRVRMYLDNRNLGRLEKATRGI